MIPKRDDFERSMTGDLSLRQWTNVPTETSHKKHAGKIVSDVLNKSDRVAASALTWDFRPTAM